MKRLAIYLRLSLEDEGNKQESNSIGNQRKLIQEYIHHDSELRSYEVAEFSDDGYSGTNMTRPGMQKMLKEVKDNNIQCIIVKDMSRFSRDYIEMGTYLNQIFPFMGIRFIAINDNYDSMKQKTNSIEIDTVFKTLLYDLYSKDISAKVKAAFDSKCSNGEYVFGAVPFGYEKSKEFKNTVIVNENEAKIVRYIFSLAMQGKSSTQIAKQLYEEKIPTITQMRKPDQKLLKGDSHTWSAQAVRIILNNRFYLGEMAYGKSVRKSVGSKDGIPIPKEEWKRIENHHEAIITPEIYEQVSSFRKGYSTKRKREKHPLTGKIYCGGCGYSLNYKPIYGKNRSRSFQCRKHSLLQIPDCCTYITANLLEETILLMLNKELMQRGNALIQKENLASFHQAGIQTLKAGIGKYEQKKKQLQEHKDVLYEKYALGELSVDNYRMETAQITDQLSDLSEKINEKTSKLMKLEDEYQKIDEDMKQIIRYSHIEKLTQEIVDTFIKKVYVYKGKRVEIEWSFRMDMGISQAKAL